MNKLSAILKTPNIGQVDCKTLTTVSLSFTHHVDGLECLAIFSQHEINVHAYRTVMKCCEEGRVYFSILTIISSRSFNVVPAFTR